MASGTPSPKTAYIKSKAVDFPCPSKLKRCINTIIEDLRSIRGRAGINMRLRQTPDSTEFNADVVKGARPVELPETPFEVVDIGHGDPDLGYAAIGVVSNSHLFNSEDRNTYEEDNTDWGLLDDERTGSEGPIPIDSLNLGDKIYLQIELDPDDQSIISIDVQYGPVNTGDWPQYPDPIEINTDDPDNPYHQYFYQIIAEITDPAVDPRPGFTIIQTDTNELQVTQLLFANLMMATATTTQDADEPGLPLLVAIPWNVLPGTSIDGEADEIPSEDDLMTPWQLGSQETSNDYNFELFNASEFGVAKVLVLDGVVISPNDDPVDPDGMPSNDTFTLDVNDGDEIWVEIDWDLESDDEVSGDNIISCSISSGPATPDDSDLTQYITIGNVSVDDSGDVPIVTCRNEVCGDIVIQYPPSLESDETLQLSVDKDTQQVVWKTSKIAQVTTEDASGFVGGGTDFLEDIDVLTFDDNSFDVYDGGGGQAVITLTSEASDFSVQGDIGFVDPVSAITFTVASDPSAGYIEVVDGGGGNAIVYIPVLPVTTGGVQVLGSDDGDVQWFGTSSCG